jgi:hypothetical protein
MLSEEEAEEVRERILAKLARKREQTSAVPEIPKQRRQRI